MTNRKPAVLKPNHRTKKTEEEGRKVRFGEGPEEDATGRIPGFQTAGITRFSNRRSHLGIRPGSFRRPKGPAGAIAPPW
jgi:hypothetical protein